MATSPSPDAVLYGVPWVLVCWADKQVGESREHKQFLTERFQLMAAVAQTTLPDEYEPRCAVESSAIVDTLLVANELEQQCQNTYRALASDTAVLTHEMHHKGPIRRTIERVSTAVLSHVKRMHN